MLFLHAQDVEQAKLLAPALDEKAVGVEQENNRKQNHDPHAEIECALYGAAAVGIVQRLGARQHAHDEEDGDHAGTAQRVGQVALAVAADVLQRQVRKKLAVHCASPPVISAACASAIC